MKAAAHAVRHQHIDEVVGSGRGHRQAQRLARAVLSIPAPQPRDAQTRTPRRPRSEPTRSAAACSISSTSTPPIPVRAPAHRGALPDRRRSPCTVRRSREQLAQASRGTAISAPDQRLDDLAELRRMRGRHQHPAAAVAALRGQPRIGFGGGGRMRAPDLAELLVAGADARADRLIVHRVGAHRGAELAELRDRARAGAPCCSDCRHPWRRPAWRCSAADASRPLSRKSGTVRLALCASTTSRDRQPQSARPRYTPPRCRGCRSAR